MSSTADSKKSIFSFFGSGRAMWLVAIGAAVATAVSLFTLLGSATATTTYYVVGQSVPARAQVTPDMMVPVTTQNGSQPGNAYTLAYLSDTAVFAKVALQRGDVVSPSNAGPATRLTENLPDNFVAASIAVDANNAVGGKVRPGDLIDVIAMSEESGAGDPGARSSKVVLQRVYVLDVSVAAETLAQSGQVAEGEGEAGDDPLQGVPALYTVAVAPEDAVVLSQIRDRSPYVVLSSRESQGQVDIAATLADIFGGGAVGESSDGVVLPDEPGDPAAEDADPVE